MSEPISLDSVKAVAAPDGRVNIVFTFSNGRTMTWVGSPATADHLAVVFAHGARDARAIAAKLGGLN